MEMRDEFEPLFRRGRSRTALGLLAAVAVIMLLYLGFAFAIWANYSKFSDQSARVGLCGPGAKPGHGC